MEDYSINTENLYKVTITHILDKREHKTSALLWGESEKEIEKFINQYFTCKKIEFDKILSDQITFFPKKQIDSD